MIAIAIYVAGFIGFSVFIGYHEPYADASFASIGLALIWPLVLLHAAALLLGHAVRAFVEARQ